MHIVLVYRCYNDGTAYYNLTFCTKKISNDRFGFSDGVKRSCIFACKYCLKENLSCKY